MDRWSPGSSCLDAVSEQIHELLRGVEPELATHRVALQELAGLEVEQVYTSCLIGDSLAGAVALEGVGVVRMADSMAQ